MKFPPWKRDSILLRLTAFMALVVFGQSVLLIGALLAGGILSRTRQNALESFAQKVVSPRNYLQGEMTGNWSHIELFVQQIAELLPQKADDAYRNRKNTEIFLGQSAPVLIAMLRSTSASGAFLILDDEGGDTHEALYFRDYDPQLGNKGVSDLYLVAGPSEVSAGWQIPLDKIWKYRLPRAQTNRPFYNKPFQAASGGTADPALLGYWSPPFRLTPPDIPIIAYTMPLVDGQGRPRGVVGVEISLYYLQRALPAADFRSREAITYLIGYNGVDQDGIYPVFAGDASQNGMVHAGRALPPAVPTSHPDIALLKNPNGTAAYASLRPLHLYPPNTPFEGEKWYVIGMMPRDNLLAFVRAIRNILLVSFAASLMLGALFGFLGSWRVTRSIVELAKRVRENSPADNMPLGKTGLREIDELSGAIEAANRNLLESTVKMSRIIELVNVPIGAFEFRHGDHRVFATDGLWRILSLSEQEAAELYKDKELFMRRLGWLMSRPEDEEEHVYKIGEAPAKWIKINLASSGNATLGVAMDVTAETRDKMKIRFARDYDSLTRLYNREAFRLRVEALRKEGNLGVAAMVMLDLDCLKPLNDTYGHAWGDIYIRTTAAMLHEFSRARGIAGRRSGDEFMLFLYGYASRQEVLDETDRFYALLDRHTLSLPDGRRQAIAISAGIAWLDSPDVPYDELLQCADLTLYKAKKTAKGRYCVSDGESGGAADAEREMF